MPPDARAGSSVNIPVDSWIYQDLERLEVKGVIESGILTTRPFTRQEGARLAEEAVRNLKRDGSTGPGAAAEPIAFRLKAALGDSAGSGPDTYFKPIERAYAGFLYADERPYFPSINNDGHEFREGGNAWAGISASAGLLGFTAIELNPEYRAGSSSEVKLVRGYAKADFGPIELLAGKEAMWWGPGYHGSLLLTNNAEPLEMVKASTGRPVLLPWIFRNLGPFRPALFIARLEEDRDFPRANLLGMRLDFRPRPSFRFALSRVIMFGGEGRRSLTASDWVKVFFASDSAEHTSSPIDGNQLISLDASYIHVDRDGRLPWSGLKLYTEIGAEDSSGNRTPTVRGYIFGLYVDEPLGVKDIDFRAEYAYNAHGDRFPFAQWYRHHVYDSGYTYKGRVIGHHMGPDAADLFLRAQYHFPGGAVIGAEADWERSLIHESGETKRNWLAADTSVILGEGLRVRGSAGIEKTDGPSGSYTNPIAAIEIERYF
ncbi:MAG: hypothetical protein H3C68_01370 [Deltaproteobacteria bacterium]|nr:hypothetical protein [Deltaproteobacteria bacterium]MBZ0219096.1 capsule assembly Wzi family protein [Deltaproteobacteria bacterium]